jgi:methyl-accepting chemotaxis protein
VSSGFKTRVVLPACLVALLLVGACAIGFAAWVGQREMQFAEQQVAGRIASLQAEFVAAARMMDERSRTGLALLLDQVAARGGAERGLPVPLAGKTVNDLLVGGRGQAGSGEVVDYVARLGGGAAELLSKDGPRFVRVATSEKGADGARSLGTELDPASKVYAAVSHGQPYYGVAQSPGGVRFIGYEPLRARSGEVVGAAGIGFKADLPVLAAAMDSSRLLETGFIAIMDDAAIQYLPSWAERKAAQAQLASQDGSWVVQRTPLAEWGLTIVSAYPAAEMKARWGGPGMSVAAAGVAAAVAIAVTLFLLLDRSLLRVLGGELRAATGLMRRIAEGDLAGDVDGGEAHPGSLMDSLTLMQLKLKNLVSAVRGGAAELTAQSRRFEEVASEFERSRDLDSAMELVRQTKAVGGTLAVLEKTVGRFRV